jgi:hypothetical protein
MFKKPRNRFQGIDSASLCIAWRADTMQQIGLVAIIIRARQKSPKCVEAEDESTVHGRGILYENRHPERFFCGTDDSR